MLVILEAMNRLKIPFANPIRQVHILLICNIEKRFSFQKDAEIVLGYTQLEIDHEILPENVGKAMQLLWNDSGIQTCFLRAREYHLNDSAA